MIYKRNLFKRKYNIINQHRIILLNVNEEWRFFWLSINYPVTFFHVNEYIKEFRQMNQQLLHVQIHTYHTSEKKLFPLKEKSDQIYFPINLEKNIIRIRKPQIKEVCLWKRGTPVSGLNTYKDQIFSNNVNQTTRTMFGIKV